MRRVTRLVCVTLVFAVLLAPVAGAGGTSDSGRVSPVLGPDFRISGPAATAGEEWPAVAWSDSAGRFLVVWSDGRDYPTRRMDVFGRWVSGSGAVTGDDFRIGGAGATGSDWSASVAYEPVGDSFLVVWSDGRSSSTRGHDIYGRRVSGSGGVVGDDFRISGISATGDESLPAVAYASATGEFLVVWQDGRSSSTRGDDIYGQWVSAGGGLVGRNFRVSGTRAIADDGYPAVAYDYATNEFLVVWGDGRRVETRGIDIYGRRVSTAGSVVGGDFRISGPRATADDWGPAVAYDPAADGFLVVWSDCRNPTRGDDIYGRRVSAAGALVGGDFRISGLRATSGDGYPAVALDPAANQFLVVWSDPRDSSARGIDIYGRRVSTAGSVVGGDFRISGRAATSNEWFPALAYNAAAGGFLVVRDDGRQASTRGYDIYGRRVAG